MRGKGEAKEVANSNPSHFLVQSIKAARNPQKLNHPMACLCSTPENQERRNEVVDSIRKGRLVVVVGTGVSMASIDGSIGISKVARWNGLLENGLSRCVDLGTIPSQDAEIVALQIQRNTVTSLIDAAQKISDGLAPRINEKSYWLKESIGQLKISDPHLITSIAGLGGILATLNYDDLLHQVTRRKPVHWRQDSEITRLIRDKSNDFILHLHGHWKTPDSVILDRESYEEISKDLKTQDLLRNFARFSTLLFIGCGETFLDPNFQTLLDWSKRAMVGEDHRHFILCRSQDKQGFQQGLIEHGYLAPLIYGDEFSDLDKFLQDLASDGWASATNTNRPMAINEADKPKRSSGTSKPSDIWTREASL